MLPEIHTFGVFLAAAYLLGAFLFWRQGRREGFASDDLLDLLFLCSLAGLLGGRVLFLVLAGRNIDPTGLLKLGEGFLWVGALIGAIAVIYPFVSAKKWSFFRIADVAVCALAAAQAVGYLGRDLTAGFTVFPYLLSGYFILGIVLFLGRRRVLPGIPFFAYLFFSGLLIYLFETTYPVTGLLLVIAGMMGGIAFGLSFWLKRSKRSFFSRKLENNK
ncbi:hypothetical protein A2797_01180 [candidate division WWE3 bacterium RIFCSPHIGHO2_01_FULL_48_15]|uniref:Prolipoprotein diacylglyceryl transferase n=1 Tax=candidate division WWE3 bacterium RIFCSPHIGHO2_01_FULL_48_15 TaxID=1802619 RepID=A0A1F4VEH1_UNCKA|nr:MAG: hypothetical protein A2797_01180 [candidate division WWE3 bacterium RIFCSPHIGHO2_01_FULL_48_15]